MLVLQAIAAALLASGGAYTAYAAAWRLLGRCGTAVRFSGTVVIGCWLASLVFHALLWTGNFRLLPALAAVIASTATVPLCGIRFSEIRAVFARDCRWLRRSLLKLWNAPGIVRWGVRLYLVLVIVVALRSLYLPVLGWDSIGYHAVKAGLWVQSGSQYTLNMPGGWSCYRLYPGGAEVFSAWAMLPFHGDLLLGAVDVVQWLALGVLMFALARQFGLRATSCWLIAAAGMAQPAVCRSVGAGYVDIVLAIAILSGVLFGARFLRRPNQASLLLCIVSLGLALAIKVTALTSIAAMLLVLGVGLLLRGNRVRNLAMALVGGLAAAAVFLPWYLYDIRETGYPLTPIPAKVGPLVLGVATPPMVWYQDRPNLHWSLTEELAALWQLVQIPLASPQLGPIALLALLFVPLRLWQIGRRQLLEAFLVAAAIAGALAAYFSAGFTVVRLLWSTTNGRFLIVAAELALTVLLVGSKRAVLRGLSWLLFGFSIIDLAIRTAYGIRLPEIEYGGLFVVVAGVLVVFCWALFRSIIQNAWPRALGAVCILLALICWLNLIRDRSRFPLAESSRVLHHLPREWCELAKQVDNSHEARVVAVTCGPEQNADNQHLYYFLGRNLQNKLLYVSPAADGTIPEFVPDGIRSDGLPAGKLDRAIDFSAWYQRLLDEGVTEVVSFEPESIELKWMQSRPELFRPLATGADGSGLFTVKKRL